MATETFKTQLKQDIITALNLPDIAPEDIKNDEALFGEGLGLDSIDSLELVVMLERKYEIKFEDPREARKVLISVNAIADYIDLIKHK
ncbi:MAG: acyl carrier protein [Saprospiraceae bacterium]|jgi:acyl carrier protein|uniref:Acyl carrier protein n=1 Tax=Candidatus Defluviibacterium haderslevense TaxID=2981993 RepID=A0A9D7SDJ5_9BACT|nr:acyl carrier protein [Candidatus Defluviibacterium haderslevense]MCC7028364.1 acyl carrier protein [Saprospiraceae bacterium]MBK7244512.1 acyl carrier protein [Candidatus Defluviibacterium haderslevense]MBK8244749.1 acyl carrier protein [Candidatus Defluviibacterium haderslevense]MBK9719939.1 acyl carrier protein [Candidatus Defluviibacterium haderslevense]